MNTPVRDILGSQITQKIYDDAGKRLTGKAQACANNAIRFLVHAQNTAEVSETVSYFCVTHAVEEAVACFISAAKNYGYSEANRINPKDHGHKATVAQFAQVVAGRSMDVKLQIAVSEKTPRLLFRATPEGSEDTVQGVLSLATLRFNEDMEDPDGTAAFTSFTDFFGDEASMIKHIYQRANFRNDALYAQNGGAPKMEVDSLLVQLKENSLLAVGLIWAAIDMSYHEKRHSEVLQLLDAITRVCDLLKKPQLCKSCRGVV